MNKFLLILLLYAILPVTITTLFFIIVYHCANEENPYRRMRAIKIELRDFYQLYTRGDVA